MSATGFKLPSTRYSLDDLIKISNLDIMNTKSGYPLAGEIMRAFPSFIVDLEATRYHVLHGYTKNFWLSCLILVDEEMEKQVAIEIDKPTVMAACTFNNFFPRTYPSVQDDDFSTLTEAVMLAANGDIICQSSKTIHSRQLLLRINSASISALRRVVYEKTKESGESVARDILTALPPRLELDIERTKERLRTCGKNDTSEAYLIYTSKGTKVLHDAQDRFTVVEALALARMWKIGLGARYSHATTKAQLELAQHDGKRFCITGDTLGSPIVLNPTSTLSVDDVPAEPFSPYHFLMLTESIKTSVTPEVVGMRSDDHWFKNERYLKPALTLRGGASHSKLEFEPVIMSPDDEVKETSFGLEPDICPNDWLQLTQSLRTSPSLQDDKSISTGRGETPSNYLEQHHEHHHLLTEEHGTLLGESVILDNGDKDPQNVTVSVIDRQKVVLDTLPCNDQISNLESTKTIDASSDAFRNWQNDFGNDSSEQSINFLEHPRTVFDYGGHITKADFYKVIGAYDTAMKQVLNYCTERKKMQDATIIKLEACKQRQQTLMKEYVRITAEYEHLKSLQLSGSEAANHIQYKTIYAKSLLDEFNSILEGLHIKLSPDTEVAYEWMPVPERRRFASLERREYELLERVTLFRDFFSDPPFQSADVSVLKEYLEDNHFYLKTLGEITRRQRAALTAFAAKLNESLKNSSHASPSLEESLLSWENRGPVREDLPQDSQKIGTKQHYGPERKVRFVDSVTEGIGHGRMTIRGGMSNTPLALSIWGFS